MPNRGTLPVTFRLAKADERHLWDWPRRMDNIRPIVVSVGGEVVLMMFEGQVVYQNGSGGIAHLIRAVHRVTDALQEGLEDPDRFEKSWRAWSDMMARMSNGY